MRFDAIDGHPLYGWDQEAILKHIFGMLDKKTSNKTNSNGMLNYAQLSRIMSDRMIHRHLKFTIVGAWVKLKSVEMFKALFTTDEFENEEDISREITLTDWLEACRSALYEDAIAPGQIRTHTEHKEIVMSQGSLTQMRGAGMNKSQFAEYARRLQYCSLRDAIILREVQKGDLVWGLYGGACEWLPASIEAVNDDGTFDLRYLLTEQDILTVKASTTAKRLP